TARRPSASRRTSTAAISSPARTLPIPACSGGAHGMPASTGTPTRTPVAKACRRNSCEATWSVPSSGASSARRCSSSMASPSSAWRSCRWWSSGWRPADGERATRAASVGPGDLRALRHAEHEGPVGPIAVVAIRAAHPRDPEFGEARVDQVAAMALRQEPAADGLLHRGVPGGEVLAHDPVAIAGLAGAGPDGAAPAVDVVEVALDGHRFGVRARGGGQERIPAEPGPGRDPLGGGRRARAGRGGRGYRQHALFAAGVEPGPDVVDQLGGATDRRLVLRRRRRGGREQGRQGERDGHEARASAGGRRAATEERMRHGCPSYRSPAWKDLSVL